MPVVRSRLPSLVKISGISCEGWLRRGRGASFAGAGDCLYSSLLSHDHSCCTDAVCTFSITLSRFGSDKIFCRYGAVYAAEGCLRSGVIVRTFLHFVQVREEQLGTDSLCF
ncbi:uncharacterized protein [Physcomitrium patens]|uniref:uncharacterized protein isoform X2 n=1 Tax=Physcomitrium patens TaxID=3218 RepID=UPI003CCDF9B9